MTLIATPEKFQTPLFLKNSVFAPLNTSRASRVVLKKHPPFYVFFWSRMCTLSYLTGPPGINASKIFQGNAWGCSSFTSNIGIDLNDYWMCISIIQILYRGHTEWTWCGDRPSWLCILYLTGSCLGLVVLKENGNMKSPALVSIALMHRW